MATDSLLVLVTALRRLHRRAGEPSAHQIAKKAGYSHTTIAKALRADNCPSWPVLSAIVNALDGNIEQFRSYWIAVRNSQEPIIDASDRSVPESSVSANDPAKSRMPHNQGAHSASDQSRNVLFHDKALGRKFLEGQEFQTYVDEARDEEAEVAILLADIDSLTQINKRCEQQVGDVVLDVCRELLIRTPDVNFGGRAGDDTFFGVSKLPQLRELGNITQIYEIGKIADYYVNAVSAYPWMDIEKELRVTCSVGYVMVYEHELAIDAAARAVDGFKEAKKRGGNRSRYGPFFNAIRDKSPRAALAFS